MDPQTSAGVAKLILAWGAPIVLLVVVGVRFFQLRRRRARARRPLTGPPPSDIRRRDSAITDPQTGKSN